MSEEFIKKLIHVRSGDDFKNVLRKAKLEEIETMVDLVSRLLRKTIPVGKKMINIIKSNRHLLRHLVHPAYSWISK